MNYEEFLEEREALRQSFREHLTRQSMDQTSRGAEAWMAYLTLADEFTPYDTARTLWYRAYSQQRKRTRPMRQMV